MPPKFLPFDVTTAVPDVLANVTSAVLSELYGTPVDVIRNQGRIIVVGTQDHDHHPDEVWN